MTRDSGPQTMLSDGATPPGPACAASGPEAAVPRATESGERAAQQAPPLDGLVVTVPACEAVTEERMLERLEALAHARAARRPLEPGEPLATGDEVRAELLGCVRGRALPLAAEAELRAEVKPDPLLPGLWEGVARTPMGKQLEVHLVLPADYPEPALRGASAVFHLTIKQAWRLEVPELESPDFISALGRGGTLEEALGAIAAELEEEAEAGRVEQARRLAVDALLARAQARVPAEQVDAALRGRWAQGMGAVLAALGMPEAERARALVEWLGEPARRAEAERALTAAAVLQAIAEREGFKVTPEQRVRYVAELAEAAGLSAEQLTASAAGSPELAERLEAHVRREAVLDEVMRRVEVRLA